VAEDARALYHPRRYGWRGAPKRLGFTTSARKGRGELNSSERAVPGSWVLLVRRALPAYQKKEAHRAILPPSGR